MNHRTKQCLEQLLKLSLVAVLFFIILYPFLVLVLKTFGVSFQGVELSFTVLTDLLSSWESGQALYNTLYISLVTTFLSIIVGGGLAWLVASTNLCSKKVINALIVLSFIIPSYVSAISWIELLGPNGYILVSINAMFGIGAEHIDIYSLEGVIFVMTLHLYPVAYLSFRSFFLTLDSKYENASIVCGSSRWQAFFRIILPLSLPLLFSTVLIIFNRMLACYGVASLLAEVKQKYVLTTLIADSLSSLNMAFGAGLSTTLLVISVLVFCFAENMAKKGDSIVVDQVKKQSHLIKLNDLRLPISAFVLLCLLLTSILPLLTILFTSFLKKWGISFFLFSNYTLGNYISIFSDDTIVKSIFNSLGYAFLSISISAIIGTMLAFYIAKSKGRTARFCDVIANLPMAVPGTVLAVAIMFALFNPIINLYGTIWILVLAYVAATIPFFVRNVTPVIRSLPSEYWSASIMSGATFRQTITKIILPIVAPPVRSAFLMGGVMVIKEIPISMLLYSSGKETIGVSLFTLRSNTGGIEGVAAFSVVIIIVIISIKLLLSRGSTRRTVGDDLWT